MNSRLLKLKPFFYFFLSWFIPGLGHFLQKRRLKAVVFFSGILSLVILGVLMKGGTPPLYNFQPITVFSFLGGVGNGIFYFLIKLFGLDTGIIQSFTYQYGTAYIAISGYLNFLIAINAYVISKGEANV